mmetsp:Transcript_16538/g.22703  ORF Transcript_16538/g.22703 Transcript_16538/m.22703 type:complete len:249 (+) Transcript_16538:349-1095(+)
MQRCNVQEGSIKATTLNRLQGSLPPSPHSSHFIRVTSTSNSRVASVLNSCSNRRLPSLVEGSGSCPAFRAAYAIVEGTSTRRRAPRRMPLMPSSSPGGSWPAPTVQASSLNSVSSAVEKYFNPPGSLAVAKLRQRMVISTATLAPSCTRASPFPALYSRYETPLGSSTKGIFVRSWPEPVCAASICRSLATSTPLAAVATSGRATKLPAATKGRRVLSISRRPIAASFDDRKVLRPLVLKAFVKGTRE